MTTPDAPQPSQQVVEVLDLITALADRPLDPAANAWAGVDIAHRDRIVRLADDDGTLGLFILDPRGVLYGEARFRNMRPEAVAAAVLEYLRR